MATEGREQNSSQNHCPAKRLTSILPILFTPIFTLLFFSAQAETGQNEKFRNNPFPNPKTLMKLTTTAASTVSTVAAVVSNNLSNNVSTTVKFAPTPNEPLAERRQNVAWFAASYSDWGFKYRSGSASIENGGFDCSGFVTFVLNYFDIKTKRTAAEQYNEGTQLPVEHARPGDLVFFGGKRNVSHVAMVVSNDEKGLVVVHSTNTKGVTQENITESKYWKGKLKDRAVNILGE
jgi:cell wall-associated NlpC family hydrolase